MPFNLAFEKGFTSLVTLPVMTCSFNLLYFPRFKLNWTLVKLFTMWQQRVWYLYRKNFYVLSSA